MEYKYEDQAKFLATKLSECVIEELEVALKKGELKHIKGEQIPEIADIVYWYFAEYNKPYPGGYGLADINTVIKDALMTFYRAKTGTRYWNGEYDSLEEKETKAAFKENVREIEIELDGRKIEDLADEFEFSRVLFVTNPIYQFVLLSNSRDFCIVHKNEQGFPEKTQYFDENGGILDEPNITYYVNESWRNEQPAKHY